MKNEKLLLFIILAGGLVMLALPTALANSPVITILHPINGTYYNKNYLDLNWTYSSLNDVDWAVYSLDNQENNTLNITDWATDLTAWEMRTNITISNNYSVDMVGVAVEMNLIKQLPDFVWSNFEENGTDIRFTDANNRNLSSYVEIWDRTQNNTIVWINLTLPAYSNVSVWMYYNNSPIVSLPENLMMMNWTLNATYQNFTSNSTPEGWTKSGVAGFDDTGQPLFYKANHAYFNSGLDNSKLHPKLPPSSNYTIDFYFFTVNSVDNGYLYDGTSIFRWEASTTDYPNIQFDCTNSSGEIPHMKKVNTWIRTQIIRDRTAQHTKIRFYQNDTLLSQCNGTITSFGTTQTRTDWSLTGGVGGVGYLRIDNFKIYKNFGWNMTDFTFTISSKETLMSTPLSNTTLTSLSEGKHNITIWANDIFNNMGQSNYTYFWVDLTPSIVNTTLNKSLTSIKINDVINLTVNTTDNVGLSFCQIIINQTGSKIYYNKSVVGTSAQCSQNFTISVGNGNVINFTVLVNDTSGNLKMNDTIITVANYLPSATNISITPVLANKTTDLTGHLNFSDADNDNAGGNQTLWYKNGVQIATANNQITFKKENFTITSNDTIIFSARFNDTYEWSSWVNSSAITVKENYLPSVTSAVINNTSPLDADDLQCDNGTTSDIDGEAVTLFYNWTKGGVNQANGIKTLSNTLTSVNDEWQCKITPFDGYENGTTIPSADVSIGTGYVPSIINFTNSTPLTAELLKGEWLNLSVNFTDANNEDKHTAYFCKDLECLQTWCVSPINITGNYTSCRLSITNTSDFNLQTYTFYTFVVDNTSLSSSSKSNTFTIQDITPPVLNNWSLQYTNLNDASGNTNQFNVSVTDNVSNINTITFDLNVTLNVSRSFTISPKNLSVAVNYLLFESSEALLRGVYNITKVTVTDNLSNSQVYNFANITFTVSAQPSSGGTSGGGGGGINLCPPGMTINQSGFCVNATFINITALGLQLFPMSKDIDVPTIFSPFTKDTQKWNFELRGNKLLTNCTITGPFECEIVDYSKVLLTSTIKDEGFRFCSKLQTGTLKVVDIDNQVAFRNVRTRIINLACSVPTPSVKTGKLGAFNYILDEKSGFLRGIRTWVVFSVLSTTGFIYRKPITKFIKKK